jgi:ribosome-associated protein
MNTEQLTQMVQTALEDFKAQEIKILDVRHTSNVTDVMIVASGQSRRQVAAIAQRLIERAKAHGQRPLGEEGSDVGEWALVDLGNIIVHVMQPQIREFYQLEKLWG